MLLMTLLLLQAFIGLCSCSKDILCILDDFSGKDRHFLASQCQGRNESSFRVVRYSLEEGFLSVTGSTDFLTNGPVGKGSCSQSVPFPTASGDNLVLTVLAYDKSNRGVECLLTLMRQSDQMIASRIPVRLINNMHWVHFVAEIVVTADSVVARLQCEPLTNDMIFLIDSILIKTSNADYCNSLLNDKKFNEFSNKKALKSEQKSMDKRGKLVTLSSRIKSSDTELRKTVLFVLTVMFSVNFVSVMIFITYKCRKNMMLKWLNEKSLTKNGSHVYRAINRKITVKTEAV